MDERTFKRELIKVQEQLRREKSTYMIDDDERDLIHQALLGLVRGIQMAFALPQLADLRDTAPDLRAVKRLMKRFAPTRKGRNWKARELRNPHPRRRRGRPRKSVA